MAHFAEAVPKQIDLNVLRYENYDTTKITPDSVYYIENDKKFIEDVRKIAKVKNNILIDLFKKKNLVNTLTD